MKNANAEPGELCGAFKNDLGRREMEKKGRRGANRVGCAEARIGEGIRQM